MFKSAFKKYFGTTVAYGVTVLMFLSAACSSDKVDSVPSFKDRAAVPGMFTDSVTTLISDSGRIRYRVITEIWKVYDKAPDPYSYFPKKIYFERFDDSLRIESIVRADTARYFTNRKLWELKNNVKMVSLSGDKFETALLYWDEGQQRIYSDSFIRIEQKDQTLTGYGFESNTTLTKYKIFNTEGPINIDSGEQDSSKMNPVMAK